MIKDQARQDFFLFPYPGTLEAASDVMVELKPEKPDERRWTTLSSVLVGEAFRFERKARVNDGPVFDQVSNWLIVTSRPERVGDTLKLSVRPEAA